VIATNEKENRIIVIQETIQLSQFLPYHFTEQDQELDSSCNAVWGDRNRKGAKTINALDPQMPAISMRICEFVRTHPITTDIYRSIAVAVSVSIETNAVSIKRPYET
jgi:hypothetical protein